MTSSLHAKIRAEFTSAGCGGLFNPVWELMTANEMINAIEAKWDSLLSLPSCELSADERAFLSLMETWE
jgi:hypothetical protein